MNEQQDVQKIDTLEPYAAIVLWQAGKGEWNKWVSENPIYNISFGSVDFSKLRTKDNPDISFKGFTFPNGNVSFSEAIFGEGDVDFSSATFGEGDVHFSNATFGKGSVSFNKTIFGNGNVYFYTASFGAGSVSFNKSAFGDGDVHFSRAKFGEGSVRFNNTSFGKGNVYFSYATFGEGNVYFYLTSFGEGSTSFHGAKFTGKFYLDNCNDTGKIKSFTFQNCTFIDAVVIKNITLNCVLDMLNTSFANHISLYGIICHLRRKKNKWGVKIVENKDDIEKLIRLKELTENSKNHEQALLFHAEEQRAKRWVKTDNIVSLIDMVFSGICDYGQSFLRPMFLWLLSIFIFAVPYAYLSEKPIQSLLHLTACHFSRWQEM